MFKILVTVWLVTLSVTVLLIWFRYSREEGDSMHRAALNVFLHRLTVGQLSMLSTALSYGHNLSGDFIATLDDHQKDEFAKLLDTIKSLKPYKADVNLALSAKRGE